MLGASYATTKAQKAPHHRASCPASLFRRQVFHQRLQNITVFFFPHCISTNHKRRLPNLHFLLLFSFVLFLRASCLSSAFPPARLFSVSPPTCVITCLVEAPLCFHSPSLLRFPSSFHLLPPVALLLTPEPASNQLLTLTETAAPMDHV